ncbi:class III lanthionine synthetase LanKC [Streptomyces aureus]|uniref:class III lanthionine synthetase LanKC n=1 Tax=Streptomyces aureus TaxID=193461 RepID=UPI00056BE0B2|nr:class III lanthionine synthetase LanKC [Streptomyces aureus]
MDNRYEAYAYADPIFYDSPRRWGAQEEFAAVTRPLPDGWERGDLEIWAVVRPTDVQLPSQGWKIHVSSCAEDAEAVLEQVYDYCLRERVTFKFLRGMPILQMQNSKYSPRGSSGKFCTLYPLGDGELLRCLEELGPLLAGRRGPYILSDLRWGEGPLFLRYGGFAERHCQNDAGQRVLALEDPEGRLVPDVRGAGFSVPDWAPVPPFVRAAIAERDAPQAATLPYTVERVLHFSNAGGVYLGRKDADSPQVVLKEARPHAGLDQRGVDAVTRLRQEHDMLARLAGSPGVPELHELLTVWEHHFLVQEFVEGQSLSEWLTAKYPLIHPDADDGAVAEYTREAIAIVDRIEHVLKAMHARGVVFGDLHPRNLIIRPGGDICFIDFELASPVDAFVRPALGAAGFTAPRGYTGPEIDLYGLAAIRLWLFLPLAQLPTLDAGKGIELADVIESRFPVPPGYTAEIRRMLAPSPDDGRTPRPELGLRRAETQALLSGPGADWPAIRDSLAAGIGAMATPDRDDRLFPGDIAQFTQGSLGLAHGAAGVLYALHVTGAGTDADHVRWLVDAARTRPVRPGLYTGGHGVAYTLDLLGERDAALALLERLAPEDADSPPGPDLSSGRAGIALTLAHFAAVMDDRDLLDTALAHARTAADELEKEGPSSGRRKAGLMAGASGAAIALVRLYEQTGDHGLLERAQTLLELDLERCVTAADGTVQVLDEYRVLPYIETGSVGIGLALDALLVHHPASPTARFRAPISRAAEPEFIIQPGLFNGRAGLLGYLALTRPRPCPPGTGHSPRPRTPEDVEAAAHRQTALDRHRRLLALHQISYQGHLAFPGDQLLRLSADLATGSAGVLLALGTALAGTPFLPWTGTTGAARPGAAADTGRLRPAPAAAGHA